MKIPALVAGMVAGADSIDDMDLLRHGGMGRLSAGVRAPSTLGSFLRAFRFGYVRQLDKVAAQLLVNLAGHTPLLGDVEQLVLVDVDDTVKATYGYAKQGGVRLHQGEGPERADRDAVDPDVGAGDRGDPAAERSRPTRPAARPGWSPQTHGQDCGKRVPPTARITRVGQPTASTDRGGPACPAWASARAWVKMTSTGVVLGSVVSVENSPSKPQGPHPSHTPHRAGHHKSAGQSPQADFAGALGYASLSRTPKSFSDRRALRPELDVDAFFVTLQKSEADCSPTTMYRDYPISSTLFTGSHSRSRRSPRPPASATFTAPAPS